MSSKTWMILLLVITVAVRLPTMFGVKRTGWDERAYVVFAQTLDKAGVSGIRQWMHDYPTNESLQKSPLLLRVGFIVSAMLTCKILGGFTVDNLAWLSFGCGIGLVLLGARFAENLAGRKMSILCGILLITSPLAAGLSRRAMQDTFAALVFLACLYFFDQCWRRRSVLAHVSLGICLCLALLTKESALVLYPMMAIAAAYYYRAMKLRPSPWLVLPLVTAPLIYLLIEIGICGGIGNFIGTYRTYASLQQTLEYTVHYEKGPWFRYLLDFLGSRRSSLSLASSVSSLGLRIQSGTVAISPSFISPAVFWSSVKCRSLMCGSFSSWTCSFDSEQLSQLHTWPRSLAKNGRGGCSISRSDFWS